MIKFRFNHICLPKQHNVLKGKAKSHKQLEREARAKRVADRLKRMKEPKRATYTPTTLKPFQVKNKPVIAPVQIKDIGYCRLRGFVLNYCTRADNGDAKPVSLSFERYEEALQAFTEAVLIQKL